MNMEELQSYIDKVREDEGLAWILNRREGDHKNEQIGELQCFDGTGARVLVIEKIAADETNQIPDRTLRLIERSREFCGVIAIDKRFAHS